MKTKTMRTKLKQLRKAARLTQAMLAERAGVSQRDVMNMEQGILSMACWKYLAVADYFRSTVEGILEKEVG